MKQKNKKSGRIKRGKGNFIGNAGEYYVMAELLKQEKIEALAPRNTPDFDVLAMNEGKAVLLRVKASFEGAWKWMAKKDGSHFRNIGKANDYSVLVKFYSENKRPDFYIIPTVVLDGWLTEDYNNWLNKPGQYGQRRNPTRFRMLKEAKNIERLQPYLEQWDSLWK
jgi:hypothetical protein